MLSIKLLSISKNFKDQANHFGGASTQKNYLFNQVRNTSEHQSNVGKDGWTILILKRLNPNGRQQKITFDQLNIKRREKMDQNFQINVKHSDRTYGEESL